MAMDIVGVNASKLSAYQGTASAVSKESVTTKDSEDKGTESLVKACENKGFDKIGDYYSYLQKNYDCLSSGNVSISGEYLSKCASDNIKAKELEDFLKKIPKLEKQGYEELAARNRAMGGTVTYYQQTWMINKDGSVQSTVYSVTETEMTNAERMKKQMDERLEKQKEKKAEEKKEEKRNKEEEQENVLKNENVDDSAILTKKKTFSVGKINITVGYVSVETEEEARKKSEKDRVDDAFEKKIDYRI